MTREEISNRILEYLKKLGPANTFKLARELAIDRNEVLTTLQDLQLRKAIEFRSGTATFLKFPEEKKQEKEMKESVKKTLPVKRTKIKKTKNMYLKPLHLKMPVYETILKVLQDENNKLKTRLSQLEIEFEEHAKKSHVKKIRKTIKKIMKKKTSVVKKQKNFKKAVTRKKVKKSKLGGWLKNIQKVQVPKFIAKKGEIGLR